MRSIVHRFQVAVTYQHGSRWSLVGSGVASLSTNVSRRSSGSDAEKGLFLRFLNRESAGQHCCGRVKCAEETSRGSREAPHVGRTDGRRTQMSLTIGNAPLAAQPRRLELHDREPGPPALHAAADPADPCRAGRRDRARHAQRACCCTRPGIRARLYVPVADFRRGRARPERADHLLPVQGHGELPLGAGGRSAVGGRDLGVRRAERRDALAEGATPASTRSASTASSTRTTRSSARCPTRSTASTSGTRAATCASPARTARCSPIRPRRCSCPRPACPTASTSRAATCRSSCCRASARGRARTRATRLLVGRRRRRTSPGRTRRRSRSPRRSPAASRSAGDGVEVERAPLGQLDAREPGAGRQRREQRAGDHEHQRPSPRPRSRARSRGRRRAGPRRSSRGRTRRPRASSPAARTSRPSPPRARRRRGRSARGGR